MHVNALVYAAGCKPDAVGSCLLPCVLVLLQAAARSHAAREAELGSREAALDAAQQQLEQQAHQLQVGTMIPAIAPEVGLPMQAEYAWELYHSGT